MEFGNIIYSPSSSKRSARGFRKSKFLKFFKNGVEH
ncbi:predicted protein [Botrytis cinerea T4]|uniref:Uncharacterized protein n=1 Tax=Botryotinia fuckeliana (strain T4) TaxID=999810 RepID=G2XV65_BOTF4|nr:predicted protein [Botrytis cinerea T4]